MGGILETTPDEISVRHSGAGSDTRSSDTCSPKKPKKSIDNEIVFILMPHIVRAQDLNDSNTKAIDVGTANTSPASWHEHSARAATAGAQPQVYAAECPQGAHRIRCNRGQHRVAQARPSRRPSTAAGSSGSAIVSFEPAMLDQPVGSTFTVNVNLAGGAECVFGSDTESL